MWPLSTSLTAYGCQQQSVGRNPVMNWSVERSKLLTLEHFKGPSSLPLNKIENGLSLDFLFLLDFHVSVREDRVWSEYQPFRWLVSRIVCRCIKSLKLGWLAVLLDKCAFTLDITHILYVDRMKDAHFLCRCGTFTFKVYAMIYGPIVHLRKLRKYLLLSFTVLWLPW